MVGGASCDDLKVSIASGSQELCPLQMILKIALVMSLSLVMSIIVLIGAVFGAGWSLGSTVGGEG